MKYGKFEFKTLMDKPIKELAQIAESKENEYEDKRQEKACLIGRILWLQNEIEKT